MTMTQNESHRPPDWEMRRERVQIITGPPGSGKTTFAKKVRSSGDIIIDFDHIADALTLHGRPHEDHSDVFSTAQRIREMLIQAIEDGSLVYSKAYIIASDPTAAERIRRRTGGKLVSVDPGIDETLRRIASDSTTSEEERSRRKDEALKWYYSKDARRKRA